MYVNEHFLKLSAGYLFPEIARRGTDDVPLGRTRWVIERTIAWYRQLR